MNNRVTYKPFFYLPWTLRAAIVFGCLLFKLTANSQSTDPYQVKAVFLFNFTQFISWPESTFSSPQAPFIVGILGSNPFDGYIREAVTGERVDGHPVEVHYYKAAEEAKAAQVLFISAGNETTVLSSLKGHSILTVSDVRNFANTGGIIEFFMEKNKVRFKINLKAAREEKLSISSKLLRLAEIVDE